MHVKTVKINFHLKTKSGLNATGVILLYRMKSKKNRIMSYFLSTTIKGKSFDEAVEQVKAELGNEGFGIPTEVEMNNIFKQKLDVDFRKYRILGACNPKFALKAVKSEKNIGVLLPCSVVVQEHENGDVEVAAVDPVVSMTEVKNETVQEVAAEIRSRLEKVIQSL